MEYDYNLFSLWNSGNENNYLIYLQGDFNDTEYVERLARIEDSVNIGPLKKPEEFCPDVS